MPSVSILVLMDFALKHHSQTLDKGKVPRVSILVLMDFALKPLLSKEVHDGLPSFNPCFDGFCS